MRVLQIVTHMNRGGLETMLMNYYRQIDRNQVQFDFLVHRTARADYDGEIEALGGMIYRLPNLNPFSIKYRSALASFFREHPEYQIVHCHLDCMSAIPLAAAKKAGVPVRIAHAHSTSQDRDVKYLLKRMYMARIPAVATQLLACSLAAGKWMFNGSRFDVLPNAIYTEAYVYCAIKRSVIRETLGLSDDAVFGHVGRFNYPKNHTFVVEIFAAIHKQLPRSKLLLVGDGKELNSITEKVCALGLQDSVIFTGVRSDVADLLQAMDVFVFPSHYEGLPVTVIEAQASGLPCLISDGVPIECKITDLVQQIPLSAGTEIWANKAIEALNHKRGDRYQEICNAGFDVIENAIILQKYYFREVSREV